MDTSAHSVGPALSTRAVTVEVTSDYLNVQLEDGRRVSAPVVWFPKLVGATADQRSRWRLIGGGVGITWPELDEDISVEGLLAVRGELLTAPTPSGITTAP